MNKDFISPEQDSFEDTLKLSVNYLSIQTANGFDVQDLMQEILNKLYFVLTEEENKIFYQSIAYLIEAGGKLGEIEYLISDKDTPIEIYEYLLNYGLKPEIALKKGIEKALEYNKTSLIDLAIEKGANLKEFYFQSLLSKEKLQILIAKGFDVQDLMDKTLNKLYFVLTEEENKIFYQSIAYLIEAGGKLGEIEYLISDKDTPIEIYEYLLNYGLKPEIALKKGIEKALEYNNTSLIDLAIEKEESTLGIEINFSSLDQVEVMLKSSLKAEVILFACLKNEEFYNHLSKANHLGDLVDLLLPKINDVNNFVKLLIEFCSYNYLEDEIAQKFLNFSINNEADYNLVFSEWGTLINNYRFHLEKILYLPRHFNEQLREKLTLDNLLIYGVLASNKDKAVKEEKELLDIIKFAINNGANINQELKGSSLLDFSCKKEVIQILIENSIKCSSSNLLNEINSAGLAEIFLDPNLVIRQKYKNLNAVTESEAKMPYILHHIWLTSENKPREIRKQDLAIAKSSKETFAKAAVTWEHIVWTNNKDLIPKSVLELEKAGIKVQSIYEYKRSLKLFSLIEDLIKIQKWGMASDTLRYSLIEHFGGVYADLNFVFYRDVTTETHKYNFFTKTYGAMYVDNFYFGANAHHPITQKTLLLVERNLINPPKYITLIDKNSPKYTDLTTANPTYLAYYSEANKYGNIDVVYPQIYNVSHLNYTREDSNISKNSIIEALDLILSYCHDYNLGNHLYEYVKTNEISGNLSLDVGNDSQDGKTWIN